MNRKDADTARRLLTPATEPDLPPAESPAQDVWRLRRVIADTITATRINGEGPWVTADAIAKALHREGYDVTPRASQGAGDAHSPTDDARAAHDPDGTAATTSGARPMRPEDVPGGLARAASEGYYGHPIPDAGFAVLRGQWQRALAVVIPAIREQVADEIEERYGPFDGFLDDQDEAVINVIRHLRGQCTICGRAPDAEPCGHAHAINLRGGQ